MKELIKKLSAEQAKLKRSRKTGSNPTRDQLYTANARNCSVFRNKTRITALLNLYHEMRGSEYRHGHNPQCYWYKNDILAFREEFKLD